MNMQTNKSWNGLRLLQNLMPKLRSGTGPSRRDPGEWYQPDSREPGEFSRPQRRGPVRVLLVVADAEVREGYLRILRETGVSHGIAAFRELCEPSPQGTPFARMKSFEASCRNRGEAAVTLVREAAVRHQPFAIALIDVDASSCDGVRAAIRIREMDPDVEIVLRSAAGSVIDPFEIGGLLPPEDKLSYL